MAALSEEFLSENDLEAVLNTNCCYEYSGNASEAAEKIATDKKDYHKCSLCVTALQKHNTNNSKKLLGHL